MTADRTRQRVRQHLVRAGGADVTAPEVARALGITRATALRHLDALAHHDPHVVEHRSPTARSARTFAHEPQVMAWPTSPPVAAHVVADALGIDVEEVEVDAEFSGFGVPTVTVPLEALERALGICSSDAADVAQTSA